MTRWLTALFLLLGLALPLRAGAAAYTFPSNMPPGCSGSAGTYTCAGLSLAYGDTVTINSPKPATITVNGNFGTDTSQINQAGSASDLTVIINGTLTLGYQANITANSVNDAGGGNVVITGNLTARSNGNIALAYQSSVTGNVTTSGTGTLSTPQSGSIGGNVTAGSGTITINQSGTIGGSVTGTGGISVDQSAIVSGNVSSGSGSVSLGFQARVNGNVGTSGAITIGQGSLVSGNITGGTGAVSIGYGATVSGTITTSSGTITVAQNAVAASCVKSTSSANITLDYQSNVNSVCCGSSCTRTCVVNNSTYATPPACAGATPAIAGFTFSGTGSASTCSPQTLTITAKDANGATLTSYTGTINLSTGSGRGDWSVGSGPAPSGTLAAGSANSGQASYTFAAGDAGVVKLRLSHSLAQNVTVTAVDSAVSGTSSTSSALTYRDNAFVWTEDASNLVSGSFVAVAGRNHDMRVSLWKKDPTTGNCSIATDYSGSRNLKLWRTDNTSSWTAPSVVSPALNPVPSSRPASNNLTLAFSSGVASFNLATTNIGKYGFNLDDDSLTYAATTVSGTSTDLTVRPFALAVTGLTASGTNNPGGSLETDSVFAKAGASFSATVTAYRWATGADSNNDGVPDSGATLAQVSAGGVAAGFNASVSLTAVAASQTPATGVLGTLANNVLSSFSAGAATTSTMTYSEVGSFVLNTTAVSGNYLGTAGLNLDALVFNASGAQQTRVGRFIPAGFDVSSFVVTHRSSFSCSPASTFSYMGEGMNFAFTLTARNASGGTTQNYTGVFAKLSTTAATMNVAGISGSTMWKAGGRMTTAFGSGTWSNGVANVSLTANGQRGTTPDGPFPDAQFGIAPVDSDGVTMRTLNLDTDFPADGVDRALLGTVPLRYGRLRLQNAMSAANRPLRLPLTAQYWDSSTSSFKTNDLDSCTRITSANLSFGNLRRGLTSADVVMSPASVTVSPSVPVFITLAAPGGGRVGSVDLALALGSNTADASCLSWTPTVAATAGANINAMRGAWCGSASALRDPSARATWGLYRGADGVVYQRENY